jgi:hypothetical protein
MLLGRANLSALKSFSEGATAVLRTSAYRLLVETLGAVAALY